MKNVKICDVCKGRCFVQIKTLVADDEGYDIYIEGEKTKTVLTHLEFLPCWKCNGKGTL